MNKKGKTLLDVFGEDEDTANIVNDEAPLEPIPPVSVEPVLPDVQFVFDAQAANAWLKNANSRLTNAYRSIRYEADTVPPQHVNFLLSMLVKAILKEYRQYPGAELERGVLYVPAALAGREELTGLERGGRFGGYVAFRRPL